MADEKPDYKVYRSRPRLFRRGAAAESAGAGLEELRAPGAAEQDDRPDYEVHRGGGTRLPGGGGGGLWRLPRPGRISAGRIVIWLALGLVAWIGLSAVLFMVSAQIQRGDVAGKVGAQLDKGPYPLTGATTILVLGSDARPKGSKEPGAGGSSRSDSIMLLRIGGGANASLSIPRDTVVQIPGNGRSKINAAYALGGPALATQTVKQYLGIEVNHVVEVNFENFPQLIDALGGVTYKGGCVLSRINGGRRNGGYTLRLKRGETKINGRQALALARTRHNLCNAHDNDLTRAKRQQQLVAAMKDKVTSFSTFIRLPWVSWAAPKAVRTDMAGPSLLGVVGASIIGGSGTQRVLKPSGSETLPDGGAGLDVSEAEKQAEVRRFLRG
jgi:LCP family protein required for cell wall assembly